MPNVDFTLSDIGKLIDERLDKRLVEEREYTRAIVSEEVDAQLTKHFMSFIEYNFQPAIDSLQSQINDIRHDIKHLRVVVD